MTMVTIYGKVLAIFIKPRLKVVSCLQDWPVGNYRNRINFISQGQGTNTLAPKVPPALRLRLGFV